jgi:hypothetical protein
MFFRLEWRILASTTDDLAWQPSCMAKCPEYDRLHADVESILGNLAQTTVLLLELFRSKDLDGVHNLDKQLELAIGAKERSLGALRQHIKEHNCITPL